MPIVSVTRLHLRSLRFLPPFALRTWAITRQLRAARGFVQGRFANEWPYGFWTMSVWESLESIRAFRDADPHRTAMRKLLNWCDEASFVHWDSAERQLPTVDAAHAKLLKMGQTSKVNRPSAAHAAGQTAGTRIPSLAPMITPHPR